MKILALSHSAVAAPYREKWRLLAKRKGFNLCLAIPGRWPEGGAMLEAGAARTPGLDLRVLGVRLPGRVGFFSYVGLDKLVEEFQPDLIYAEEEPYSLAAYQAARLAKQHGARFAFFSWENIRRRYKPPLNWIRGRVQSLSSGAVFGTSESARVFKDWGWQGAGAVIPQYGVDTRRFKPLGGARGRFTAGFVGRLAPEKGADLFVQACKLAGVKGVIAGQGPEEGRLKAMGGDIRFLGFVPFEKRRGLFGRFDVLVLPSRSGPKWKEQFGRVIIEAAACGLPCLGSDSGAIPEVVGKGGLIFPEGNVAALASRLRRLAGDAKLRRRLGAQARAGAVKHHDERRLAVELGDFLESLLEN